MGVDSVEVKFHPAGEKKKGLWWVSSWLVTEERKGNEERVGPVRKEGAGGCQG